MDPAAIRSRLAEVRERIARAASRARRDPASIRLIAVSKTFDVDHIRAAADAGQLDFGENKVQEALQKMAGTADLLIRWHLVGHLQSNKARKAGAHFDAIHSVDDAALVSALDAAALGTGRRPELLVQVDLAGEPTKHGVREEALGAVFDLAPACRAARVVGLMLLPPVVGSPDEARGYFRALGAVRQQLLARGVEASMLSELSMGMSHDFEVAVEEGATMVRVGTAIFGGRTSV
ncbi:MAG: YggS family pyridoxal phosphate-dependent enzyme [Acidobacteria bacterium]|nr:MAG: YggS family pyridoxal phosphate-dependent enzyme [Acidobacteriota bacterium]